MRGRRSIPAVAAALAGTSLTIVVSAQVGMSGRESGELARTAFIPAALAGVLGGAVLWALRHRSVALQTSVVTLTALAAVGGGAWVAARAMFFSQHDLQLLGVVLVASGTTGVVVALALGSRVGAASRELGAIARRIGEGSGGGAPATLPTLEMSALATELDAMAAKLDAARASERALEVSRRGLVAWVSHDLRTPLAGIRAMAEALEDSVVDDPDTVARYHRTLRVEADRLAALVDDLFELSRIHSGALALQLDRASLGDLVSDALAAADAVVRTKGVRLEGRLNGSSPDLVLSVPEVSRVLRNLLENAIRHTPSDGTVWVDVEADSEAAYVSVADACGGIPDDDLDRVFDLAFRGEAARTPGDGGAGLGLAIAKGLVEAHHGDIAVANEADGCRFTVRLPRR